MWVGFGVGAQSISFSSESSSFERTSVVQRGAGIKAPSVDAPQVRPPSLTKTRFHRKPSALHTAATAHASRNQHLRRHAPPTMKASGERGRKEGSCGRGSQTLSCRLLGDVTGTQEVLVLPSL